MSKDEQTSVETYGGYYIGRYESGIEDGILNTSDMVNSNTAPNIKWTGYRGGKLVVQKGKKVWDYITRDRAIVEAEKLYNKVEKSVQSKLCSSYAWDTALKFIETQNSTYPTNSVGGYYNKSSPTKTGYDTTHPCNIYDMGGNVWEWTTEKYSNSNEPCTIRGGDCSVSANYYPAGNRYYINATYTYIDVGFRITLYM